MIRKFCLTSIILLSLESGAENTCGRTAIINNQEVLVDISFSNKGEGLRPYLNKDATAKSYLDQYQKQGLSQNKNAIIGSMAIGLLLGAAAIPDKSKLGPLDKQDLIATGISFLAINFLVAKTMDVKNENLLRRSIDEYNKRNNPKIYFLPYQNQWFGLIKVKEFGLMAGLQASF